MTSLVRFTFALILLIPAIGWATPAGLHLQGEGTARYLGVIKVYDAALYAPLEVTADQILNADTSRCLRLVYRVALTAEDFRRGADTILSRQNSAEKLARVSAEIDRLHEVYKDVEKGDAYSLCFDAASRTTTLSLNQEKLTTIQSIDFAEIYFGIWLGPVAPIDATLRDRLLAPLGTD